MLAFEARNVIKVGNQDYPFLGVPVDADWPKCSFGHSYSALSKTAVITGSRTEYKCLRHRTCFVCDRQRVENNNIGSEHKSNDHAAVTDCTETVFNPNHICYHNWTVSLRTMDADILKQG